MSKTDPTPECTCDPPMSTHCESGGLRIAHSIGCPADTDPTPEVSAEERAECCLEIYRDITRDVSPVALPEQLIAVIVIEIQAVERTAYTRGKKDGQERMRGALKLLIDDCDKWAHYCAVNLEIGQQGSRLLFEGRIELARRALELEE